MNAGEKIRALLAEHGWSQAQLAKRAGLRHRNISSIVAGTREPAVSVGLAIAEALEVSADWLWRDVWGPDHPAPPQGTLGALDTSTVLLECLRRRRFAREALHRTIDDLFENLNILRKKIDILIAVPSQNVDLKQELSRAMELASAYRALSDTWCAFDRNLGSPIRVNPDEVKARKLEETWFWLTRGYETIELAAQEAAQFLRALGADASSERMRGIITRLAEIVFERNRLLPETASRSERGTVTETQPPKGERARSRTSADTIDGVLKPRRVGRHQKRR